MIYSSKFGSAWVGSAWVLRSVCTWLPQMKLTQMKLRLSVSLGLRFLHMGSIIGVMARALQFTRARGGYWHACGAYKRCGFTAVVCRHTFLTRMGCSSSKVGFSNRMWFSSSTVTIGCPTALPFVFQGPNTIGYNTSNVAPLRSWRSPTSMKSPKSPESPNPIEAAPYLIVWVLLRTPPS